MFVVSPVSARLSGIHPDNYLTDQASFPPESSVGGISDLFTLKGNLSSEADEFVYAKICVTGCRYENHICTPASRNTHNKKGKNQFTLDPFVWIHRLKRSIYI